MKSYTVGNYQWEYMASVDIKIPLQFPNYPPHHRFFALKSFSCPSQNSRSQPRRQPSPERLLSHPMIFKCLQDNSDSPGLQWVIGVKKSALQPRSMAIIVIPSRKVKSFSEPLLKSWESKWPTKILLESWRPHNMFCTCTRNFSSRGHPNRRKWVEHPLYCRTELCIAMAYRSLHSHDYGTLMLQW